MAKSNSELKSVLLWSATFLLAVAMLVVRVVFPEILWATIVVGVLLLGALGILIQQNHRALRSRSMAFGAQSLVTVVLVLGIIGVLNFMVSQHPLKWDMTANKVHTLSEDTIKLMRNLKAAVKVNVYVKTNERERFRALLDNYKLLNATKFEVEYVDPDKESLRAKQNGIKKYGTIQLQYNGKDAKVDELSEEKLTNAMIKLLKDKNPTFCMVTGHGERSISSTEADGFSGAKKNLEDLAYAVKEINLVQDAKSVSGCDALAIIGPTKSFFEPEIKTLQEYLDGGGHAMMALDLNIKGAPYAPELDTILSQWFVKRLAALVVDPYAQALGGDAAMPLIIKFATDNAITRDFKDKCFFPFLQPLETLPNPPAGLTSSWLAQTTPQAWGISDLKSLSTGKVNGKAANDKQGPLNAAIAVTGKREAKATKATRLVVYGTSFFATNNFSRYGGNLDLFLNTASWLLEDESFISIHSKDDTAPRLELSMTQGRVIGLVNMVFLPLFSLVAGFVIWFRRRRL